MADPAPAPTPTPPTKAQILADIDALDSGAAAVTAAHTLLNGLTDQQVEIANQVGAAVSSLNDAAAAQTAQLNKVESELEALYGSQSTPGSSGQLASLSGQSGMTATGPVGGFLSGIWSWILANPAKALQMLQFLASILGISTTQLKARIEAAKAGN